MPLRHTCGRMMASAGANWYDLTVRTEITPGEQTLGTIQAISAETGETMWTHSQEAFTMSLVTTGGGLVFGGDSNGRFKALDDETGEVLWEINIGSPVTGFPITYAVDGKQYVAVGSGGWGIMPHYFADNQPDLDKIRPANLLWFFSL